MAGKHRPPFARPFALRQPAPSASMQADSRVFDTSGVMLMRQAGDYGGGRGGVGL